MKIKNAYDFVVDYCSRHKDPTNAALHVIGVPMAFIGMARVFSRKSSDRNWGILMVVAGYTLQYIGHKHQGNEVGEISLIKFLFNKIGPLLGERIPLLGLILKLARLS